MEETKEPMDSEVEETTAAENSETPETLETVETDPVSLREKIHQLEEENKDLNQQFLRLRADVENIRRRTQVELLSAKQLAVEEMVLNLLPVLDNFERALLVPTDSDGWRKGIEMVARQLQDTLAQTGLEAIAAVGETFDPTIHEAVMRESTDAPEGTVLAEMQKGYKLNDKVIRPSMVKVAQ